MNNLEKLFVIKRFNEVSNRADLCGGDSRGAVFATCDNDYMRLRLYGAKPRQDFQAVHFFHPNVQHDERHVVSRDVSNEILAVIKLPHYESFRGEQEAG